MNTRLTIPTALLLLVTAACGAPSSSSGPSPVASPPPSAGRPASAAPTARPSIGSSPQGSAATAVNADGSVWIRPPTTFDMAQPGDGAVWGILQYAGVGRDIVRIDPRTNRIETLVRGLPILQNPVAPVGAHGSVWLVSWDKSSVTQYDAESGDVLREIEVGLNPIEPVVAYGDVWTINHNGDSVTRIDSETGEAHAPIDLPGSHPLSLIAVDDHVMLVNGPGPTTFVVDPKRMKLVRTYEPAECFERSVAIDGHLWSKRCDKQEIAVRDPGTGRLLDAFDSPAFPHFPHAPLMVDGVMWLPAGSDPGVFRLVGLHPRTHAVVGTYEVPAEISEGWAFAAFDSWWRWGWEGLVRVPADTLREAAR